MCVCVWALSVTISALLEQQFVNTPIRFRAGGGKTDLPDRVFMLFAGHVQLSLLCTPPCQRGECVCSCWDVRILALTPTIVGEVKFQPKSAAYPHSVSGVNRCRDAGVGEYYAPNQIACAGMIAEPVSAHGVERRHSLGDNFTFRGTFAERKHARACAHTHELIFSGEFSITCHLCRW